MSHSFCLSRATLLRRRPDESARERSALAVVRVPLMSIRFAYIGFQRPLARRSCRSAGLAYAGRAEQHASRSSVFRTHGSRVQFLDSPDFECVESVNRRVAPARLFGRKPTCEFRVERHDGLEDAPSENALPATGSQLHRLPDLSMATASISTAAPNGSLETSTVERAGRNSPKKSA